MGSEDVALCRGVDWWQQTFSSRDAIEDELVGPNLDFHGLWSNGAVPMTASIVPGGVEQNVDRLANQVSHCPLSV